MTPSTPPPVVPAIYAPNPVPIRSTAAVVSSWISSQVQRMGVPAPHLGSGDRRVHMGELERVRMYRSRCGGKRRKR